MCCYAEVCFTPFSPSMPFPLPKGSLISDTSAAFVVTSQHWRVKRLPDMLHFQKPIPLTRRATWAHHLHLFLLCLLYGSESIKKLKCSAARKKKKKTIWSEQRKGKIRKEIARVQLKDISMAWYMCPWLLDTKSSVVVRRHSRWRKSPASLSTRLPLAKAFDIQEESFSLVSKAERTAESWKNSNVRIIKQMKPPI